MLMVRSLRSLTPPRLPRAAGSIACQVMETPPPDPQKLLAHWMEWERGETPPGRVMSSLKTGGMRDVLEALAAKQAAAAAATDG